MKKYSLSIAAAVLGLIVPLNMAIADEDGGSLPALTAQWWQWALSIPTGQNPQLDPTGQYCMVGQRGSLWFLGGVFSGGPAERTCSVPEGITLFFPVINEVSINSPNVCGSGPENEAVKDLRQMSKAFIDAVPLASVKVQVDGKKAPFRRVQSQVFAVALPNDNVFDAPCGGPDTVPAGIYSPAVDDGYYVTLGSLKPGMVHTIHFQAEQPTQPLPTDVTYNLTVVPVSLK
ncbi:MAG: hypothetical protein WA728_13325 [Xanthobacteraceae bacterium]